MPVNKNVQPQEIEKDSAANREPITNTASRSGYKAPGTRFGTLLDWRVAAHKTGIAGRYGRALRDGQ